MCHTDVIQRVKKSLNKFDGLGSFDAPEFLDGSFTVGERDLSLRQKLRR
jgi:hypothetical protein